MEKHLLIWEEIKQMILSDKEFISEMGYSRFRDESAISFLRDELNDDPGHYPFNMEDLKSFEKILL